MRRIYLPLLVKALVSLLSGALPQPPSLAEGISGYSGSRVDPYVAKVLAQEPVETQRAVIGILTILKSIAKGMTKECVG